MTFRFSELLHTMAGVSCVALFCTAPAFAYDDANSDSPDVNTQNARLDVRVSELEEQIRKQQGTIEQLSFENKQLKGQLEKSQADIQYRLTALEQKQATIPQASVSPVAPPRQAEQPKQAAPETIPESDNSDEADPAPPTQFLNPKDSYNHAFSLLNQAQYPAAGKEFEAFTKKYPKDPLIGNAYYWWGETNYVQRDYAHAADEFRQGYEAMPSGPKAADNLLKLAMSLNAQKKDKEACIVLRSVISKFGASSSSVKPHAEQEMNRIGCSN